MFLKILHLTLKLVRRLVFVGEPEGKIPWGFHVIANHTDSNLNSGKSSMLSALSKILQTSRGSITVDGLDLKWISPDTLRERILTLPQNAVLVPGSIRENVDPSGTLSDPECISFLEKVGLWEFLEQQGGLDAPANEQSLSAGQSQLFGSG